MKTLRTFLSSLAVASLLSFPASAHFQLVYSPDANIKKSGNVPLKLLFWHPMENGHVMDMGEPVEFYSVFKGKKTDLKSTLKQINFQGRENQGIAYDASVKLKRNGDYALVVKPAPYYEQSEDIFIQQITKSLINKGGTPTDWNEPLGLQTEILPLNKPYAIVAGSTFSGVVLKQGKPVAGAEIEIEYLTAEPDMTANKPRNNKSLSAKGGTLVAISDANGVFSFGIPKAGFWGFAALGTGPQTEYEGKELSQDAVLWIKAHELEE